MAKKDTQKNQVNYASGDGHLGGTRFGQQPGDAKITPRPKQSDKSDDTKPSDKE
jgi:hypothetical protein